MSLTRKFYNALAKDLKDARPPLLNPDETPLAVWAHCVAVTANNLALNNGSFNRDRFYEACGLVKNTP